MGRTVVIFAAGSRGDLQPCVALGRDLAAHGDEVRIIAGRQYAPMITGAGLGFAPLSLDPTQIVNSPEGQELLGGGRDPVRFLRNLRRIAQPLAERLLEEVVAGSDGADLFLGPTLGFLGHHLSEYLGIPHAIIHFQPSHPTGAFPHPFLPRARLLGPHANRLSFAALDWVTWQLSRPFINPWRAERLKLPRLPLRSGPLPAARRAPVLCAFSPSLVRRPADWPPNVHLTGFWFLDRPDWEPPADLLAFLDAGPPPVYVGFGSMATKDPAATDRQIRAALRQAGLRGILHPQPGTDPEPEDDMFVARDIPHGWLFPHLAAVVHHGGAGTTAEGLRAGVPSVICPFFGDQPFWADRVHSLGAGPSPLPAPSLTADSLATRLHEATQPPHRTRAQTLSHSLRSEHGITHARNTLTNLHP